MMKSDYEQKKCELWVDLALDSAGINKVTVEEYKRIFNCVFDKAYELGKQEKDTNTIIQGWVARDFDGCLWVFSQKPKRNKNRYWEGETTGLMLSIDMFPDLTWSEDPIEVGLIIK